MLKSLVIAAVMSIGGVSVWGANSAQAQSYTAPRHLADAYQQILVGTYQKLAELQHAVGSGILSESEYWQIHNNITRQIYGRLPGYRTQIDQMIAALPNQELLEYGERQKQQNLNRNSSRNPTVNVFVNGQYRPCNIYGGSINIYGNDIWC